MVKSTQREVNSKVKKNAKTVDIDEENSDRKQTMKVCKRDGCQKSLAVLATGYIISDIGLIRCLLYN